MPKSADATLWIMQARLGADLRDSPPAASDADDHSFLGFDYKLMNQAQRDRVRAFWAEIEELELLGTEDEDALMEPEPAAPTAPVSARPEAIPFVLGARWAEPARKAGGKKAVAAEPGTIVTRRHMEALERVYADLHRLAGPEK